MITNYRLYGCQAQTGCVHFGGIRHCRPCRFPAFESRTRVRNLYAYDSVLLGRTNGQSAAHGHGIERIRYHVLEALVQQLRVAPNLGCIFIQQKLRFHWRPPTRMKRRFKRLYDRAHHVVGVHCLHARLTHLGKVAESRNDLLQILHLRICHPHGFEENLIEPLRRFFARPRQIFERKLQREKRHLQFQGKIPGQLAPRRHALGLQQPLAFSTQLRGHVIEGADRSSRLASRTSVGLRLPVPGGKLTRRLL